MSKQGLLTIVGKFDSHWIHYISSFVLTKLNLEMITKRHGYYVRVRE